MHIASKIYIIYINEHIPKNKKYCIFRISECSFYEAVNTLHASTFLKSKKVRHW